MKYVIAGGSGFLGQALVRELVARGDEVVVLSRGSDRSAGGVRFVHWPDGDWARELDGADGVVNLAGAGIADKRWSAARKEELRQSRLQSTRALVGAMRDAKSRPAVFISGSAVGYYGARVEDGPPLDESAPPGNDFFSTLGVDWEAEAHGASALGVRTALLRTGIVLSKDGGALQKLLPPFRMFVGGPLASGRQVMSWIHLRDWVELVVWILRTPEAVGAINATAPQPVTNREFSSALGTVLGRPSWLPVPGFALRVIVGEMAGPALIAGQRVIPRRALDLGFTFQFPEITAALRDALN